MSKEVTLYNKSKRSFVFGKDLVIKAGGSIELEKEKAEKLAKAYRNDLTLVKASSVDNSDAVSAELEKALAYIAELEAKLKDAETKEPNKKGSK